MIILLLGLTGCDRRGAVLYSTTDYAMGTAIQMTVWAPDSATAQAWIAEASAEFQRIGYEFWEGEPNGNLGKLNRERETSDVELIAVINKAFSFHELTRGAFDPRVGELVRRYGFVSKVAPQSLPDSVSIYANAARQLRWEKNGDSYSLIGSTATITLGGIAKGYAVDQVVALLKLRGCRSGMINAGGDLRAWGAPQSDPWHVGIENPDGDDFLTLLSFTDGALATSGSYRNRFIIDGFEIHHILDAGSGMPARGKKSVTIFAPDCMTADALATGAFVMDWAAIADLSSSQPELGILLLDDKGILHRWGTLADYENQ